MEDMIKLLAQYGIGGILAGILGVVTWKIGQHMIKAIADLPGKWETTSTRIIDRIDGHTKEDIAALSMLVNRVDVLQKTTDQQTRTLEMLRDDVQEVLERTPVESPRPPLARSASGAIEPAKGSQQIPTNPDRPRGSEYSLARPATDGGRKK